MLGTRGVRLGILFPAIYEMQVEAIFRALAASRAAGVEVHAEVMVPLVDYRRELEILREQIERIAGGNELVRGARLRDRDDDRAAARLRPRRRDRRSRPTSARSGPTT